MRALDVKLLRDLRRLWPQLLAIDAVIAAGVAVCITPESTIVRLREIPGIDVVESRVVADVTIDVPGFEEPAVGRLISIPDEGPPTLNQLLIRRGSYPAAGRGDQVLASEAFVTAHRLREDATFGAIINGRWKRFTIAGVALSPEYVYSIRGGDLFPGWSAPSASRSAC
jgi:putative ABC transport system permease protein